MELQRTVIWIVNINIGTWSGIWCLDSLVDGSLLSTIESSVNCLFLDNPILDVVFLLFMIILARSWVLGESLSCVWSLSLVLPKLTSLGLGQKGLGLLTNKLSIRCRTKMIVSGLLNGHYCLVGTWAWSARLNFGIFAVRNL